MVEMDCTGPVSDAPREQWPGREGAMWEGGGNAAGLEGAMLEEGGRNVAGEGSLLAAASEWSVPVGQRSEWAANQGITLSERVCEVPE